MIPYEELCQALNRWRVKNGLPVGSAAIPAAPPPAATTEAWSAPPPAATTEAWSAPPPAATAEAWAAPPPAVQAAPVSLDALMASAPVGEATTVNTPAAPPPQGQKDGTSEIDISDVIDAEDMPV